MPHKCPGCGDLISGSSCSTCGWDRWENDDDHENDRESGRGFAFDGGTAIAPKDLTRFQYDILVTLAKIGPCNGLDMKGPLTDYIGKPVNHGRLYPNLDKLVAAGLISKERVDERTNEYELTAAGEGVLYARYRWLEPAVEGEQANEPVIADGGREEWTMEDHLEAALEEAELDMVSFHIRSALQQRALIRGEIDVDGRHAAPNRGVGK